MIHARHHGHKPSPHPLLMWYARCPTLTALGLIANRGVLQREFLRENVSVLPVRDNASEAVRTGHFDHSLPHLLREADAATALWAQARGARSCLIALGSTYQSISLVARPSDRQLALSDLAGLKLSLPREAGPFSPARARSGRAWQAILALAGITSSDVTFQDVEAGEPQRPYGDVARHEIQALNQREVDAVLLYGAKGLETIRNQGLTVLHHFTPDQIRETPELEGLIEQRALTVDPLLLESHPDAVHRICERLWEVPGWAQNFPREAIHQAGLEAGVSHEDAERAYGHLTAESAELGLEAHRMDRLERLRLWLAVNQMISPAPADPVIEAWSKPSEPLPGVIDLASA